MYRITTRFSIFIAAIIAPAVLAAEAQHQDLVYFEKHVRPILIQHCYACHSEAAGKRKGGLWLDRKAGWETGGDTGPAILPGNVEDSLLIQGVRYESFEMPPQEKLPDNVVARLEEWVRRGAYDPRTDAVVAATTDIDIEAGRKFWCFQPVADQTVPVVIDKAWPLGDIDHFVLATLEAKQLKPAPDATRETLLRRVTLALTGLPPTIAEQDAFLVEKSPHALERVVDRLLKSNAFAERWARHWLDIVRYADTSGGGGSKTLSDAWRLRDYVIDCFRKDKPLDELIREHIAGDLLPFSSHEEQVAQLTATGFLVLGPHNYGAQDRELLALEIADEQIDTLGKAFLGMTLGCARCHDHKFDPIPARDYYALAGIFLSTKSVANEGASIWFSRSYPPSPEQETERAADKARIKYSEGEVARIKAQIKTLSESVDSAPSGVAGESRPGVEVDQATVATLELELLAQQDDLQKLLQKKEPVQPTVMCVGEVDQPHDTQIRVRGRPRNLGPIVPRGFLQVATLPGMAVPKIEAGSGRLELAHWIASDENPLTARVLANRIWQHLFGFGIVRSSDNFGTTGILPTHPELLDHLARRLSQNGWSTRKLVREIVLSRAWQMGSASGDPSGAQLDPENKLLWRAPTRRIDAETLRDSVLMLSGSLDMQRGGPNLPTDFKSEFDFEFSSMKRSIYIPVFRNQLHEIFSTFDFANPNFVVGKRFTSTIPTQSLYLLNSPFIHRQAELAAEQLLDRPADAEVAVVRTYRRILCRRPRAEEMALTLEFLESSGFSSAAWASLIRSLYSCVDFQYIH